MTATDLLEDLQKKPFEPLRLYVVDGSTYDIRHPEQCMVSMFSSVVGVSANPNTLLFDRLIRIDNNHIHKVEPIRGIPSGSNSQKPC
jgi:hypothetical protein